MDLKIKLEQARNGKIAIYSGPQTVMLTFAQINGMGIEVSQLEDFDLESYQKAYHLEDATYTGIPVPNPKRADFFRTLLEEYRSEPQTSARKAITRLLQEMSDELPKDWLSYEHRPPQKFIGTISETHGNADKIVFKTSGGNHLWEVSYEPALREFIMHGWDIGRHRRYDYDIDTDLVASVDGTRLVGLDWLVPWNADEPWVWRLEVADSLRCSCAIHEKERIYLFVQAIPCADENGGQRYRYSEAFISVHRYAPTDIVRLLLEHGRCVSDFRIDTDDVDWRLIAGILAQQELANQKNMEKPLLTFEEVRDKIAKETKLDLSACQQVGGSREEK